MNHEELRVLHNDLVQSAKDWREWMGDQIHGGLEVRLAMNTQDYIRALTEAGLYPFTGPLVLFKIESGEDLRRAFAEGVVEISGTEVEVLPTMPELVGPPYEKLDILERRALATITGQEPIAVEGDGMAPDDKFLRGVEYGFSRAWAETAVPRPLSEYHEDCGVVLWWAFPITEPPYVGTPNDRGWPRYHTHWTQILVPKEPEP